MGKKPTEALKTMLVKAAGLLLKNDKDADESLGELLLDVQRANIYGDGKIFVDLVPAKRIRSVKEEYALAKQDPLFDIREFVSRHFYDATDGVYQKEYTTNPKHSPLEHIEALWGVLERRNRVTRGSLLPLPYAYVVPGGRFNEQFYWDTYFIMLGLASSQRWDMVEGMVRNFAHQIRKYGYIPTANRSYLLSRSQPPFFSHMVELLAIKRGRSKVLREYLPYLVAEYRFWMRGTNKLHKTEHNAYGRVAQMPDESLLNRYYDNKATPRPESLREDMDAAAGSGRERQDRVYLHLRAAAESGWDFSSRWFTDAVDIHTIHTADIIPVDLNSLLYHLESTIADAYEASFNLIKSRQFKKKAEVRAATIQKYLWDDTQDVYKDYNFHKGEFTGALSVATLYPLYVGIASQAQADSVANLVRNEFLRTGGLVATLTNTGQQWDAPNGWAPLHWVAVEGLRRYGHDALADDISGRWLALNEKVYKRTGKFIEKYNVENAEGLGGGGEYQLQDGFGWSNGVYAALKNNFRIS